MNKIDTKGFQKIIFPYSIKKIIKKSIKESLSKKINEKFHLNEDFRDLSSVSNFLKKVKEKDFVEMLGHVSLRYLEKKLGNKINFWLKKNITNKLKRKKISLHYPTKIDLNKNPKLSKKQFCIYFRCVRPKLKNDVGEIHRDVDFWNLLRANEVPKAPFKISNVYRLWIPINGCNSSNSLKFYKGSHLDKKVKTLYYKKNGRVKPMLKKKYFKNKKFTGVIKNFNNEAILFRDDVVHFAPINKNKSQVRYSVECSIIS